MISTPRWLDPSARTGGGMWPLGLEAAGFAMADRLLPGINTTVVRPRYYAFFCWVFWTYQRARPHTRLSQDEWLQRLEMLLRFCTQTRSPGYTGLVGTRSVPPVTTPPDAWVSLEDPGVVSAYSAAFYSSSFGQLGCVGAGARRGAVTLSESVGVPLAEAFEEDVQAAVANASSLEWVLSDEMKVPAQVVYDVVDALALRPVEPHEAEHAPLVDLFLRLRPPDDPGCSPLHDARTRSMVFLLDLLAQLPDGLTDSGLVHDVFATRDLPTGMALTVEPGWEAVFQRWERFQERQFEKIALYGTWSVLIELLQDNGGLRPTAMMESLQRGLEESELLSQWVGADALNRTVGEARERISEAAHQSAKGVGGTMLAFVDRIRSRGESFGERAAGSLLLLLLVTTVWEERREGVDQDQVYLHRIGGPGRLALDPLLRDIERRAAERLWEFARWVMGSLVIGQANRVALEKVARGQANVFLLRDEVGYRARPGLSPWAYVHYDDPAVFNAFAMLEGLRLVEIGEGYQITATGRQVLERARQHLQQVATETGEPGQLTP